jgi:uncharacterized protein YdhG (YjbR/CyaY superfamily)
MLHRDVITFIASADPERRAMFEKLQDLIFSLYPDAETKISYGIPTYFVATGRIYLGYWKGGVSIYPGFPSLVADFQDKYPLIKTSKGTISFRLQDEMPIPALIELIHAALLGRSAVKGDSNTNL